MRDKLEIFEELARIFSGENNALAQRELLVREGTARFADTVGENDHHMQKILQKHSENSRVTIFSFMNDSFDWPEKKTFWLPRTYLECFEISQFYCLWNWEPWNWDNNNASQLLSSENWDFVKSSVSLSWKLRRYQFFSVFICYKLRS